jgi:hypothetical protein
MSNAGSKNVRRSFFYVFVAPEAPIEDAHKDPTAEVAPDVAVRDALGRLSQYKDVVVKFNPSIDLRRALGIKSLPAFAISENELNLDGSLQNKPENLPSIWNLLKFRKRKRILESGMCVPTVEREIISLYKTPDSLYQFVRDLHLANTDSGIVEAGRKVESEARRVAGNKIARTITVTRKIFHQ